ncbi:hypothetical protein J6590_077418 [Homalodisca vitripennis]|nr:hypothetical protein J6590_077418 [Homalodisca vitripennis]
MMGTWLRLYRDSEAYLEFMQSLNFAWDHELRELKGGEGAQYRWCKPSLRLAPRCWLAIDLYGNNCHLTCSAFMLATGLSISGRAATSLQSVPPFAATLPAQHSCWPLAYLSVVGLLLLSNLSRTSLPSYLLSIHAGHWLIYQWSGCYFSPICPALRCHLTPNLNM